MNMEDELEIYEKIFAGCFGKLEKFEKNNQIRDCLKLALDKTLVKVRQGKISPAIFPLLIARDLGKDYLSLAYQMSEICAFFHTAADLTDDIEDDDENNPLINKVGKSQAINLANKLLFISQQLIMDLKISEKSKLDLVRLFSESGSIMSTGQFFDIFLTNNFNNEKLQIEDIALISERKSGTEIACFFSCLPLALGIEPENFYNLGFYCGALMQVHSDYMDIYGTPLSEDLIILKSSMPIFAAHNDLSFSEEVKTLLSGKNDLVEKQFILKRVLARTKAVEEFEKYFHLCQEKIRNNLNNLPELPLIKKKIEYILNLCNNLILTLYDLRRIDKLKPIIPTFSFDKSIAMALDNLKSDNHFEDVWEMQRWGFLGENRLTGNIFTPALIIETLLDAGIDVYDTLNYILSQKGEKGWHYYSNTDKIPLDADDLGQLLNLAGRTRHFKSTELFKLPLKLLELNLEDSGRCPTWLADQDKFQKEEVEISWFGNECAGVMANLYYGLFLFDREKYRDKILKGIHYIISKFDPSTNSWPLKHYPNHYPFYLVSRLINALNLDIASLNLAKEQMLKTQKLNGSWNNSPQDTAFVLLGLLTFKGTDPQVIKSAMIYLQDTQKYDGSWEAEDLFVCPGKDERVTFYRNPKVTGSFCLRALLQGQNKLNSTTIKQKEAVTA
jgi:geranylgeranyl pyrophosphate synthase